MLSNCLLYMALFLFTFYVLAPEDFPYSERLIRLHIIQNQPKLMQKMPFLSNTIEIPFELHISILSWSLKLPPGWIIAFIPYSFASSTVSANGKNPSLAKTA